MQGTVEVSGAKNAALPILAGTLLATEPVVVRNVPQLKDVATTITLSSRCGTAAPGFSYDLMKTCSRPFSPRKKGVPVFWRVY